MSTSQRHPYRTRPTFVAAAFTTVELLVIAVILIFLGAVLVPNLQRNREAAGTSHRTGITTTLTRIQRAKDQYVAEQGLKNGDPLTLDTLVQEHYVNESDIGDPGSPIRYIVGAVGTPVTYTFEEPEHPNDHDSVDATGTTRATSATPNKTAPAAK